MCSWASGRFWSEVSGLSEAGLFEARLAAASEDTHR